jgi:hypothetical protein
MKYTNVGKRNITKLTIIIIYPLCIIDDNYIYISRATHKHPCRSASNPNKENLRNVNETKRGQPPSKILKKFN